MGNSGVTRFEHMIIFNNLVMCPAKRGCLQVLEQKKKELLTP